MTETTTRKTKRVIELEALLETANQRIADLTTQLAAALEGQDARREVPELVIAQIVTNRDLAAPKVVELRVGDIVLRKPDGTVVVPAKNTAEVGGKHVASSYFVPGLNLRFDRMGQSNMPAPAAATFIERARATGWVPAE